MKKILVIEDDPLILDVYKKKLESEGFSFAKAITVDEGLRMINTDKPDLVILDIMLPGNKNGFDALEEIKKNPSLENTPVIILTNLETEESTAKSIGAYAYFIKSNTQIETVVKKVKEAIGI
jgi:DNA-binding response OmpR family regulator